MGKVIVSVEQCYDVTRTVCTESIEVIPNEVCSYSYETKNIETTAKTVEVAFNKESDTQMVTVCQPGYGGYGHGGYGGYGHQYCNEVAQETQYNVPSVPVDKCTYALGEPACQKVELTLPKQVCVELVYGYAHEEKEHAPAPHH